MALISLMVSNKSVGRVGKNRIYMGASAPKELVALIDARGEALGWSRAQFMLAVLEWWRASGAPAISKIDETMRAEVMAKLATSAKSAPAGVTEASKNPQSPIPSSRQTLPPLPQKTPPSRMTR